MGALPLMLPVGVARGAADGALPRIGWLKIQDAGHTPGQIRTFLEGLAALGLAVGRDFALEQRFADGDARRLPALASELLQAGARIIVATSQPSIAAAMRVTRDVPIVGRMIDDPVATGMAQSLAIPGGNITGVYSLTEEMNPKRLALLKEVAPAARRVGVLLRHDWPNAERAWRQAEATAGQLDLALHALDVRSAEDISQAFAAAHSLELNGILTFRNHTVVTHYKLIAEMTQRHRLPAVFDASEYVEAGGLMSYGPNIDAIYGRLAVYVEKLLRGVPAGQLPIEQPTKFELVVSAKAAQAIGLIVPTSLLAQADEVIE